MWYPSAGFDNRRQYASVYRGTELNYFVTVVSRFICNNRTSEEWNIQITKHAFEEYKVYSKLKFHAFYIL